MQAQHFQILSFHYFSEGTDINSQSSAMPSLKASRNRSDILVLLDRCDSLDLLLEQKCLSYALCFSGKLLQYLGLMQLSSAMSLLVNKKCPEQKVKVYRCPISGNIQGQVGQGSGQLDLGEDVPAYCWGIGVDDL